MNNNEYTSTATHTETTNTTTLSRVFTGNEPHDISLKDAARLTKRFRDSVSEDAIKGGFFARNAFEKTLAQDGCVGIRFYLAAFDDGTPTIVMAGVTHEGNDIWDGVLSEEWLPCPPFCPAKNVLNSAISDQVMVFERNTLKLTGKENHLITLAEASRYISNFSAKNEPGSVKGGYMGRKAIEKILAQEHCVGIRLYFAVGEDDLPAVIFVGEKSNGDDILPGIILGNWISYPSSCSVLNPLNR